MDPARSRRREAHTQATGELRVATRHECRRFFVPHLDEPNAVLARTQRLHDPVDAVAGQAEDDVDVPVQQGLDQYVSRRLRHAALLARIRTRAAAASRMPATVRGWGG